MAILKKAVIQDFRNIAVQELDFSSNLNCITGGNGEGKTNLLDAIWYLSMTKSAITPSDAFNFRHGTHGFALSGSYILPDGRNCRVSIKVDEKEGKTLKKDDKEYTKISEHIGLIPIVMVSPADSVMVTDSGEERRRFVNAVLSQIDCSYLYNLQVYNKLLQQRNKLLHDGKADSGLLDVIDERMSAVADPIHHFRHGFTKELLPSVQKYYERISDGHETISIKYRSQLGDGSLADILRNHRNIDMTMGYTTVGLHRDDFVFEMDGYPIRRCGSQGQQKSFLVSVKFAQYDIMKRKYGYPPMLLLDDLFDKLDMDRVANLLEMVSGSEFGQIFISDANKDRTRSVVDSLTSERRYFEAKGGTFLNEQD